MQADACRSVDMIDWLDAHTHLDSDELFANRTSVLDRAWHAGVRKVLLVNSEATESSFERTLDCLLMDHKITRNAAFGIHPHHASIYNPEWEKRVLSSLNQPKVVALGEIGLDFYYNNSPQDQQITAFRRQLQLALERQLPVVIHCRDAYIQLADILAGESKEWKGMIHCFTGTPSEVERLLDLGFFISFSGIVTFRSADTLRDSARLVPMERILIETDAPFLAPVPHRGKTNEPAFVAHTGAFLTELKQMDEGVFSRHVFENYRKLFGV